MNGRPISITIVSILFIVVGAGGLLAGLSSLVLQRTGETASHQLVDEGLRIISGCIALTSGVFMLRRASWARWFCMIWLALHVVLSIFHTKFELIVHFLFLLIGAYLLFRRVATQYFTPSKTS